MPGTWTAERREKQREIMRAHRENRDDRWTPPPGTCVCGILIDDDNSDGERCVLCIDEQCWGWEDDGGEEWDGHTRPAYRGNRITMAGIDAQPYKLLLRAWADGNMWCLQSVLQSARGLRGTRSWLDEKLGPFIEREEAVA